MTALTTALKNRYSHHALLMIEALDIIYYRKGDEKLQAKAFSTLNDAISVATSDLHALVDEVGRLEDLHKTKTP